ESSPPPLRGRVGWGSRGATSASTPSVTRHEPKDLRCVMHTHDTTVLSKNVFERSHPPVKPTSRVIHPWTGQSGASGAAGPGSVDQRLPSGSATDRHGLISIQGSPSCPVADVGSVRGPWVVGPGGAG